MTATPKEDNVLTTKIPTWLAIVFFLGGTGGATALGKVQEPNIELIEYRLTAIEKQLERLNVTLATLTSSGTGTIQHF